MTHPKVFTRHGPLADAGTARWLAQMRALRRRRAQASGKSGHYRYYKITKRDGDELVGRDSHRRVADAIGFTQKRKLGEVPSFANEWRARQDSNL